LNVLTNVPAEGRLFGKLLLLVAVVDILLHVVDTDDLGVRLTGGLDIDVGEFESPAAIRPNFSLTARDNASAVFLSDGAVSVISGLDSPDDNTIGELLLPVANRGDLEVGVALALLSLDENNTTGALLFSSALCMLLETE